jgi:hypothetical protein
MRQLSPHIGAGRLIDAAIRRYQPWRGRQFRVASGRNGDD